MTKCIVKGSTHRELSHNSTVPLISTAHFSLFQLIVFKALIFLKTHLTVSACFTMDFSLSVQKEKSVQESFLF